MSDDVSGDIACEPLPDGRQKDGASDKNSTARSKVEQKNQNVT